jgi:hypothetical protein
MSPEELEDELKAEGIDPERTLLIVERAIAEADRREREEREKKP